MRDRCETAVAMTGEPRGGLGARALAGVVRGYQLIVSPWFAPTCRYYPSCSSYAIGALRVHGAVKGSGLAIWRLLRCNPWSRGGVDHVPPAFGGHAETDAEVPTVTNPGVQGRTLGNRTSR
ncbi:MAG: membrane protein insertion efficiency factor YidD [Beutenbergiaceae bacterium]